MSFSNTTSPNPTSVMLITKVVMPTSVSHLHQLSLVLSRHLHQRLRLIMRVALKVELSSLPSCSWTLQTGSFAIAHGLKLVRVRNQGRSLFWNRYMDNQGNQIEEERAKFIDRIEDQRGSGRRGGDYYTRTQFCRTRLKGLDSGWWQPQFHGSPIDPSLPR